MTIRHLLFALVLSTASGMAAAQGTQISLGGASQDTSQPVEVSADSFEVDQASGKAVFSGNVLVSQGDMKLTAGAVEIIYAEEGSGGISELLATGGVTFVTETEAAEGQVVVYDVDAGTLTFTGNVLLTQGQTALSGDKLAINLVSGTAVVEGRVRTVFQPSNN